MKSFHKTVARGTLAVCIIVLPGAQVGAISTNNRSLPRRIERELAAANNIWQKQVNGMIQGVKFKIKKFIQLEQRMKGIDLNAEHLQMVQRQLDQRAQLLMEVGRQICQDCDVFVFYMNGNSIGPAYRDGTRNVAISFIDYPMIIMSNGAQENDYILAHELGHFMFNNHISGRTSDPNPFKKNPAHNASPTNLMYPHGQFWPKIPHITDAQIKKALETRFFY